MDFSISSIGTMSPLQIHVVKETEAPKTVFTMENSHLLQEYERGMIRREADTPLLKLDSYCREGYRGDYKVKDALTSLWKATHNRFNLNDPTTWQNLSTSLTPTQEELDSMQKELSQNGLDGTVDWAGLRGELDSFRELKSEDLGDGIDYFSSRYVAIKDKLERNFSGDELAAQQEKLGAVYQQGVSYLVDGYAKKMEKELGLSNGQAQTVRESLQVNLDQAILHYESVLDQVKAPASPSDAWLQNHDAYIAARLRETTTSSSEASEGEGLYTMNDLVAACRIGEAYQVVVDRASHGPDEVRMALDMGMVDIKTEALINTGKLSSGMAKLLQSTQKNRHQEVIAAADERLKSLRGFRAKGEPTGSFALANQGMIQTIYQKVMDTFRESGGNAVKAIYQGVERAKSVTTSAYAQSPEVSRWGISMASWLRDFYTPREAMGIERVANERFGIQNKTNTDFQNYADSWQHFLTTRNGGADSWYLSAEGSGVPAYLPETKVLKEYA